MGAILTPVALLLYNDDWASLLGTKPCTLSREGLLSKKKYNNNKSSHAQGDDGNPGKNPIHDVMHSQHTHSHTGSPSSSASSGSGN